MWKKGSTKAKVPDFQMPRVGLFWLMIAQIAVVLPHVGRVPMWVMAIGVITMIWRVMVFLEKWSYPSGFIKAVIVVVGGFAILFHFGIKLTLESAISLLILGFFLKLVEMYRRRDAYVVAFLSFIIILSQFLYGQEISTTLYQCLAVVLVSSALVGINLNTAASINVVPVKTAAILFLQAIPLMVVLFVLFPRLPPLWAISLPDGSGLTGVGDSMTPGDFVKLGKSDALAFRASFEGEMPPVSQLYWRGMVFSSFDGRGWRRGDESLYYDEKLQVSDVDITRLNSLPDYSYQILLEPTRQRWLYGLPSAVGTDGILKVANGSQYRSSSNVEQQLLYSVDSYLDYSFELRLSQSRRLQETQLPSGFNPRTVSFASAMREKYASDDSFMRGVLQYFRQQAFFYTLRPPRLGFHSVDDFLFGARKGFCEHYASSFVVLMRAAGVPARVVAGYQGGEINSAANYILVHQLNAHAWAEVWLKGEGWVRVDPTAAVAPERVERGIEDALREEDSFLEDRLFSPLKYRGVALFNNLRLRMDRINFSWNMYVVGYSQQKQYEFLKNLLGNISSLRIAIIMGLSSVVVIAGLALIMFLLRPKKKLDVVDKSYRRFLQKISRLGLVLEAGESPNDFARRINDLFPALSVQVSDITELYLALKYKPLDLIKCQPVSRRLQRAVKKLNIRRHSGGRVKAR